MNEQDMDRADKALFIVGDERPKAELARTCVINLPRPINLNTNLLSIYNFVRNF
jgi:hypothetical protein